MTLADTVLEFARLARNKADTLTGNPLGFAIAAMMAGAYVGMGILLIFSVGQPADPSIRGLIMGTSFGIALTLVVFAGSELFTGHTMYMAFGRLARTVSTTELCSGTWEVRPCSPPSSSQAAVALYSKLAAMICYTPSL